ncbi:MAG: Putative small multi-drug export [Clostridia bacterium 41_269]|nr:MAG: Putative small multi-drug export [Clostridia bacterium 41_269]
MTQQLLDLIKDMPAALQIIILAALPVTELRFSIPAALAMGMSPWEAFGLSAVGNGIPAFLLLLVLEPAFKILSRIYFFKRVIEFILERTRKKGDKVQKYGALGLMMFVAVPLPGTGVWTGSLLAYFFGINFWYALLALWGGMLIAGVLVTLASLGVIKIIAEGYGLVLLVIVLVLGFIFIARKGKK